MKVLEATIELKSLTFQDWVVIAGGLNQSSGWAYYRWIEVSSPDLSVLGIEDWEKIRDECEFKEGWAYFQWKDNRG